MEQLERVLLLDDDPDMHQAVEESLAGLASVRCVADADAFRDQFSRLEPAVALIDLELEGDRGDELVDFAIETCPLTTVLVLSSVRETERVVSLMRRGAEDSLSKPFSPFALRRRVERVLARRKMVVGPAPDRDASPNLALLAHGTNSRTLELCDQIRRVAPSDLTALVVGETGTGKELVARALHEASEVGGPFVTVNCGALPRELMEAELFGHTAGAFTGARGARKGLVREAEGGTLFLDEIGELPLELQPKLLRFLQEGELRSVGSDRSISVQTRVVAATHQDLQQLVYEGAFREDLYFRLRVVELHVPPLRERRSDIPGLAERFLREASTGVGRQLRGFEKNALRALVTRDWPGNVRQLQHLVQRAAVFSEGPLVGLKDLGLEDQTSDGGMTWPRELLDRPFPEAREAVVRDFERAYVRDALRQAEGNVAAAARAAGVPRKSLWRIAQRVGLAADRAMRRAGQLESTPSEPLDPMAEARVEYISRAQGVVEELEELLGGSLGLEGWSRIRASAHRLRGSGGTYGFPGISESAARLEEAAGALELDAASDALVALASAVNDGVEA